MPPSAGQNERRRFEVLGLLGRGGFGDVHLAILRAGGGFEKRVALKILTDPHAPTEVLQRFRDEARVLGMIRDRAVVSVDPPVWIDGHWAVVMEYVDGVSLAKLMKEHRTIPSTVALEVVQEVCRVLDKLWHIDGPEGRPLHLLHRDLKPANLQITRAGEVKVLDFGLAKGDFDRREAVTTQHLSGTAGYIAPERFVGEDHECTDVFSMGILLWTAVTGQRPTIALLKGVERNAGRGDPSLDLALAMLTEDPEERLTPAQAEVAARDLLRRLDGPTLRDWAREHVPAATGQPGPLDGQVLSESTHTLHSRAGGSVVAVGGAALGGMFLGAGALALLVVGGLMVAGAAGLAWVGQSGTGPAPRLHATVTPLQMPESVDSITMASDGSAVAFRQGNDVFWSATPNANNAINLTSGVDARGYEVRIAPDGRRVMFGYDRKVWVVDIGSDDQPSAPRELAVGIPGGWLPDGKHVSVLILDGVTSTGDAADASVHILDVDSGALVQDVGIVKAEPRHGRGAWTATRRKGAADMVLVSPEGVDQGTGQDLYPIGFAAEGRVVVGVPTLGDSTVLRAVPLGPDGQPLGSPYELTRLPHEYATDSHIPPNAEAFIIGTREANRAFQQVVLTAEGLRTTPLGVPSDVSDVMGTAEKGRHLYVRAVDGADDTAVRFSVTGADAEGREVEQVLHQFDHVHQSWSAGSTTAQDRAWFLLERAADFVLVELTPLAFTHRQVASLPSTTLLAAAAPDGRRVAITHDDLQVHVLPLDGDLVWAGPPLARGEATGWSPDGRLVLWDPDAKQAFLLDPDSGSRERLPFDAKKWSWNAEGVAVALQDDQLWSASPGEATGALQHVKDHSALLGTLDEGFALVSVQRTMHLHRVALSSAD